MSFRLPRCFICHEEIPRDVYFWVDFNTNQLICNECMEKREAKNDYDRGMKGVV